MVVVSGNWVKNVSTFSSPNINGLVMANDNHKMSAKASLVCRPNSLPFQDRTLTLDQPVKVGRSVAKIRANHNNAIFDCRVLSRNHALLWYENGKFFLQDTKSSNGTFVNNNKLSYENVHHEVCSGDIVQFGVDVVESNCKVTHGCIIATIKLYLPDGKEAKASPSITESNRHGMVPYDELYKLNQIIQEATQRELCLETKLIALQLNVDNARQATEESWAAYVGEERLLSRIATLENQLAQASKNFPEESCRLELFKLQDENILYQVAAKDALEKLHNEKLDAISTATEEECAKVTAQQEVLAAREQLLKAQKEVEDVVAKLTEVQKRANEDRIQLYNEIKELQEKINDLESKYPSTNNVINEIQDSFNEDHDDFKLKEKTIAENELENKMPQNNITLNVTPVDDIDTPRISNDTDEEPKNIFSYSNDNVWNQENSFSDTEIEGKIEEKEIKKEVSFKLAEDENSNEKINEKNEEEKIKKEYLSENIDSKTLKYQFQSTQNELKKKIENLETLCTNNQQKISDLEQQLSEERHNSCSRLDANELLKEQLTELHQKLKESMNEGQQLRDKVKTLRVQKKEGCEGDTSIQDSGDGEPNINLPNTLNTSSLSFEEIVIMEEEIVYLKERFAHVNEEKLKMAHDFKVLKAQYDAICNQSSNTVFYYVAPLIVMVLYLLISSMIS